jgi:hypothetical protein
LITPITFALEIECELLSKQESPAIIFDLTGEHQHPTDTGTPQGGVISPMLANIGLHGLEDFIKSVKKLGVMRQRIWLICQELRGRD